MVARDESPKRRFLYAQSTAEGVHRSNTGELLNSSAAVLHLVKKQTHHYPHVTVDTTMFATFLDMCRRVDFCGLRTKLCRTRSMFSSEVRSRPERFCAHRQPLSWNVWCQRRML